MLRYRLGTYNNPQQIYITIQAKRPCTIQIVGTDAYHKNSIYERINKGNNEEPFVGEKVFNLKLPIAPKQLLLRIKCSEGDSNISVKLRQAPLDELPFLKNLDSYLVEFVRFASKFAKECGYSRTNKIYQSTTGQFTIKYLKELIDPSSGKSVETPARIERETGVIEINSKIFKTYSIPMRMFILLHEIMHRYKNTRDEFEADKGAGELYEGLGFPRIEAIYSYTRVFKAENPEQAQRKIKMLEMMIAYKKADTRSK